MGHPTNADSLSLLVVDDDPNVAAYLQTAFERRGHRVVRCHNPDEAVAVLASAPEPFDLALVDFVLPGINGVDLIHRLRVAHPFLPVVLITGSADAPDETAVGALKPCILLRKPFLLQELRDTVTRMLDSLK
jgi:DNA-binding NtrC family response regulator